MSFARQKRVLLGLMALLAPLPLPFNEVVGWPVVGLYLAGVLWFLRRALRDEARWLPHWGMNLLGGAYLPVFLFDLLVVNRGHLTQPVLHLCLFTLLVKLFALTRERDKWQAAIGIFFLFLAAMGTSVHPTIVLYLIAFLVLALMLLTRFAFLHVLAGHEDEAATAVPVRGLLAFSTVFSLVAAVPLFTLLPRVRAPFIVGRGAGTGTILEAAGLSDAVTLDAIGNIRTSRAVALRFQVEGSRDRGQDLRFKAATFDLYTGDRWRRSPRRGALERSPVRARFYLSHSRPEEWIKVWLQPLHTTSLPLPVEAAVLEPGAATLDVDHGGAVSFVFNPLEIREYRVGLAARPVLLGDVPGANDPALNSMGVTPRITALAARVMGTGSPGERASRLENHLATSYAYTLDFTGRSSDNPIEDFLFRYRSGQCEYFASAMVLMLRSQGIPARLVTGFLGGEYNPFEGYTIVRDSNAHAWVEAWLPGEGWRIFDPTPPSGRPEAGEQGPWLLAHQAWDFVIFRWDRYVLTYGLADQLQIFGRLHGMWQNLLRVFEHHDAAAPAQRSPAEAASSQVSSPSAAHPPLWRSPWVLTGVLVLAALATLLALRRLRRPLSATDAYARMRRRLGAAGLPVTPAVAPLALRRQAAARFPSAAEPAARVIDFYLRESFGGQPLDAEEAADLRSSLAEAERTLREAS